MMDYEKRQKLKNVLRYLWMAFVGLLSLYAVYSIFRFYWDRTFPHPRMSFFLLAPVALVNAVWILSDEDFIDALPVPGLQCAPDEDKRIRITVSDIYFFVTSASLMCYLSVLVYRV